ncbi:MAG TPA: hypothetical protein VG735_07960 [Caulobacterales bacterium]|nr:hypothetical protein [Caulobacterales bacterium]
MPPTSPDQRHAWRNWYKSKLWLKRRAEQLGREPWCAFHLKRGERVEANTADHIERHNGNWTAFSTGRLQSLCHSCHSSIKQSMERGKPRLTIGPDGWPVAPTTTKGA